MLNTIGFRGKGITVDSKVNKLSGGERQGVAIGRAMHFEAEIIILDEPTVALSLKEVRKVLNFVHKIKEGGKACIYISHNIQDVYEISDRFVVLDRGEIVASIDKKDTSLHELDEFLLEVRSRPERQERIMKQARSLISVSGQNRGPAGSDRSGGSDRRVYDHGARRVLEVADLHVVPADGGAAADSRFGPHFRHHRGRDRPEFPGDRGVLGLRVHLVLQEF